MTTRVAAAAMALAVALQPRGASAQDSTVVSDSLSGLTNAFANNRRVNNVDVPLCRSPAV